MYIYICFYCPDQYFGVTCTRYDIVKKKIYLLPFNILTALISVNHLYIDRFWLTNFTFYPKNHKLHKESFYCPVNITTLFMSRNIQSDYEFSGNFRLRLLIQMDTKGCIDTIHHLLFSLSSGLLFLPVFPDRLMFFFLVASLDSYTVTE